MLCLFYSCIKVCVTFFNLRGTPVCGATPGPDRFAGPDCHVSLWDSGQTPAYCLLAAGGQPGETLCHHCWKSSFSKQLSYHRGIQSVVLCMWLTWMPWLPLRSSSCSVVPQEDNEMVIHHQSTAACPANLPGQQTMSCTALKSLGIMKAG